MSHDETQHKRRIGRTFALAAKSVTMEEYQRFDPGYGGETTAMVPDRRLPGAGHQLVSGGGILQLVEQTGGVAGERMVLEPVRDAKALPATDPEYKVG